MDDGFEGDRSSDPVAGVRLALRDFKGVRRGPDGQPLDQEVRPTGGILEELEKHPGAAGV
ncbi:MAG: hypothetical protein KBD21_04385 [Candidatus Pacebacteria bacterium]|nr:hypothetical protein [Candidatus Paceibacterota bacterium]